VTDTREEFHDLFELYGWVTGGVVALVFALVLFAVLRYRRRGDEAPARRSQAHAAESVYAIVLAVIATVLVAATFVKETRVDRTAARPDLRVEITAFQWQWRFRYPGLGVSVVGTRSRPARLVVPVRKTIEFAATSRDVIHSFWIPATRFKRDAFPGRTTRFDLFFEREGTHVGRCAEFCGLRHAEMTLDVVVVSADRFRTWVADQRRRQAAA
jgi:cytochrome c oxidase subunit II